MNKLKFAFCMTFSLLFIACSKQISTKSAIDSEPIYFGPTEKITPPPVLPNHLQPGAVSAAAINNLQKVFADALPTRPAILWRPSTSMNPEISMQGDPRRVGGSISITFYDFYGASFAYVTQTSTTGRTVSETSFASRHNPALVAPADTSTWETATYVTGANTRRTPISASFYQFPILYGIYSTDSASKGFNRSSIAQYVAASDSQYWAKMTDGRYFDLLKREFISSEDVTKAKQNYDEVLAKAAADGGFGSYADSAWSEMSLAFDPPPYDPIRAPIIDKSYCSSSSSAFCGESAENPLIKPQSLTWGGTSCVTRWFLWFKWNSCDSNIWSGEMPITKYSKRELQEKDPVSGFYEGCGPASGASLLWWWKKYKGYNTIDNDYDIDYRTSSTDMAYKRAKTELIMDMKAFNKILFFYLPGYQRAVWPWEYAEGLNRYLDARGIKNLLAKREYGWGPAIWGKLLDRLKTQFSKEEPVTALHASLSLAHYGVLKSFKRDPFGDIWGTIQTSLSDTEDTHLNLSAWWVYSGVYWLESTP